MAFKTLAFLLLLGTASAQTNFNWLDTAEYPFAHKYFQANGQNLHYIDEGEGDILLFVHGTPSWSFDFRNVIKELSANYRCIAIDHIGFGLSDKPKDYDYSTQNHAQTLEKFILEKGLTDITLVLHDFGGPIGLSFATRHPEKVAKLVILNSWCWSSEDDPKYQKFAKVLRSPLLPFMYKRLNFSPKVLLPKSFGDHKPTRNTRKHYTKPFPKASQRNGTLAFAHSLLNDQDWFAELWNQKSAIDSKHTLFIWGMKDEFIGPEYLEKFEAGFLNSTTLKLESSGHFPQEEEPKEVAKAIQTFMLQ